MKRAERLRRIRALSGSVRKWKAIVAGTGEDNGPTNCPCCREWFSNPGCAGCPIAEAVDNDQCDGTPYETIDSAADETRAHYKRGAQAELHFLEGLLRIERRKLRALK